MANRLANTYHLGRGIGYQLGLVPTKGNDQNRNKNVRGANRAGGIFNQEKLMFKPARRIVTVGILVLSLGATGCPETGSWLNPETKIDRAYRICSQYGADDWFISELFRAVYADMANGTPYSVELAVAGNLCNDNCPDNYCLIACSECVQEVLEAVYFPD